MAPGPGHYEVKEGFIRPKVPNIILDHKSSKKQEARADSPGPGAYNLGDRKSSRGAIINPDRTRQSVGYNEKNPTPAPGSYLVNEIPTSRSVIINPPKRHHSRANASNRSLSPAPGQYDPNDSVVRPKSPFISIHPYGARP